MACAISILSWEGKKSKINLGVCHKTFAERELAVPKLCLFYNTSTCITQGHNNPWPKIRSARVFTSGNYSRTWSTVHLQLTNRLFPQKCMQPSSCLSHATLNPKFALPSTVTHAQLQEESGFWFQHLSALLQKINSKGSQPQASLPLNSFSPISKKSSAEKLIALRRILSQDHLIKGLVSSLNGLCITTK